MARIKALRQIVLIFMAEFLVMVIVGIGRSNLYSILLILASAELFLKGRKPSQNPTFNGR